MPFLCQQHHQNLSSSPADVRLTWQQLMCGGVTAHQSGDYLQAYRCFGTASEVASLILGTAPPDLHHPHPIDMWVTAIHNLSATLDAAGQGNEAEDLLRRLHRDLLSICLMPDGQRHMRIAALACLDTTLFSLASQLGKAGKAGDIYQLICESDRVGETAAKQLFH